MGWQSCTDKGSFTRAILEALAKAYKFKLSTPFEEYPKEIRDVLLYGTGGREVKVHYKSQRGEGVYDVAFEGLIENVNRRYKETFSESSKAEYETYMRIDQKHLIISALLGAVIFLFVPASNGLTDQGVRLLAVFIPTIDRFDGKMLSQPGGDCAGRERGG